MDEHKQAALQPFAELFAGIITQMEAMSNAELKELAAACAAATPSNCWWATNRVAKLLLPMIITEQHKRAFAAHKAAPRPAIINEAFELLR